ncbi:MAG: M15 family metallopeptidase [Prevotellaceae bacterium]|jgi:D-alanyl-D-alanine carboxypeptidase|nr:M15 family metallopeptidase [Prevotellaceae bacterium]
MKHYLLFLLPLLAYTGSAKAQTVYSEKKPYIYTPQEVEQGGFMLLVNKVYRLPQGYVPRDLQYANDRLLCAKENTFLNATALDCLEQMFFDAKTSGIELIFFDGWREEALQQRYYDNKIKEKGYNLATTLVAPPRGSEHELGLAADILSTVHQMRDGHFALTSTGKWLISNCWKYGFILRYPQNKIEKTRFLFEPWHYRFVGVEEAKKITQSGLCLDEYVEKR